MIHVLDALTVRPGRLAEVRTRVRVIYQPILEPLGARLVHTWISPPVELIDDPTELLLLWEYPGTAPYWRVRREAATPDTVAFWHELEPLLVGRSRRIMLDPDDTTVLR